MTPSPLSVLVESLGWTLVHFVWQGALVAAILYFLLTLTRRASAQIRYLAACGGLLLASATVALTLAWQITLAERTAGQTLTAHPPEPAVSLQASFSQPSPASEPDLVSQPANSINNEPSPIASSSANVYSWPNRLRARLPAVVALWAAGVGLLSLRLFVGWQTIRRLCGAGSQIDDPLWIERFANLRQRLGVSRPVRLLTSASANVPFVVGSLRPVILVPAALVTGLAVSEIEAIFAHELAHVRRHDFLVNLLQNLVETLLFYHPAIWWISAQIRKEREHCCDDMAAAVCGGALNYAKALVAVEQLRPAANLVVAASGGSLLRRIRRLAGVGGERSTGSSWALSALVLILGAGLALVSVGRSSVGEPGNGSVPPATFQGDEIIARVGSEVILASDVLPDANRHLQKVLEHATPKPTDDEIVRARKLYMAKFLQRLIETKLVVAEARRKIPKEAWGKVEKQFNAQSDNEQLPKLIAAAGCQTRAEFETKLRKFGDSLEELKHRLMENALAEQWLTEKTKDDREITQQEAQDYYQAHLGAFERPARARWEHVMVRFANFDSKEDARRAIASAHRDFAAGTTSGEFAAVQLRGENPWTDRGSLASKALDEALFTLPVGQLSEILEDQDGFQVIRVTQREAPRVVPFDEVQPEIRNEIHDERIRERRQQYLAELKKKYPVWTVFEAAAADGNLETTDESANPADDAPKSVRPGEKVDDEADPATELPTKVDLPKPAEVDSTAAETSLRLAVRRRPQGQVELYLNDQRTDEASLKKLLADRKDSGNESAVLLSADKKIPYTEVVKVIDLLTSLGVQKVSLQTIRETAEDDKPTPIGAGPIAETVKIVVYGPDRVPVPRFRVMTGVRPHGSKNLISLRIGNFPSAPTIVDQRPAQPPNWAICPVRIGADGQCDWAPDQGADTDYMLHIEAEGCQSQTFGWLWRNSEKTLEFHLNPAAHLSYQVWEPKSKRPAAGATVAIATARRHAILENLHIMGDAYAAFEHESEHWGEPAFEATRLNRPWLVKTDSDGRFEMDPSAVTEGKLLVVHPEGALEMTWKDLIPLGVNGSGAVALELQPWARVDVQVQWQDQETASQRISLSVERGGLINGGPYDGFSGSYGIISFPKVLPGAIHVSRLAAQNVNGPDSKVSRISFPGLDAYATAPAGMVTHVTIGGRGQAVIGRLVGRANWDGVTFSFAPPLPAAASLPGGEEVKKLFEAWADSSIGPIFFRDELQPKADGTFEIPKVLPGRYELIVSTPETPGGGRAGRNHDRAREYRGAAFDDRRRRYRGQSPDQNGGEVRHSVQKGRALSGRRPGRIAQMTSHRPRAEAKVEK